MLFSHSIQRPHLLSGPQRSFLQSVGCLKLALSPVEGAQVLQGGGNRGAAKTRRGNFTVRESFW